MKQNQDRLENSLDIIDTFQARARQLNDATLQIAVIASVGKVQQLRKRLLDGETINVGDRKLLDDLELVLRWFDLAAGPIDRAVEGLAPYVATDDEQPEPLKDGTRDRWQNSFERFWLLR